MPRDWLGFKLRDWWVWGGGHGLVGFKLREWWVLVDFQNWRWAQNFYPTVRPFNDSLFLWIIKDTSNKFNVLML